MDEVEELRQRVEELKARVGDVEKREAGTRHLAATADIEAAALRDARRSDSQLMQILLEAHARHGRTLRTLVSGQHAVLNHFRITPPEAPSEP